jgi:hypothetical protein
MIATTLSVLFIFGQVPSISAPTSPAALVAQLGAARYADREAAADVLVRLGRAALPALRDARLAPDMEIRTRALNLIRKIEGALLLEPTKVHLEFENLPLSEIVHALNQQVAFRICLYPENFPRWKSKRLSIHEREPIDFWRAVDRLCEAADLQYNSILQGYGGHREPVFTLMAAAVRPIHPNSDYGPFRVSLIGIHYQRDVSFGGPQPSFSSQFHAQLQVATEPRLAVQQTAAPRLIEAVDDRGNSLIPRAEDNGAFHRFSGYFGMSSGPVMQVLAALQRPIDAGQKIKRLRGVIPVAVSSRQPDPLVVPLQNAAGKTFGGDELQITVHSIKGVSNNRQSAIELSIKGPDSRAGGAEFANPDAFNPIMPRINLQQLPIEIFDARGQMIPWSQTNYDAETAHVILTLSGQVQGAPVKELRYFTLNRATTGIPFDFSDVLLP